MTGAHEWAITGGQRTGFDVSKCTQDQGVAAATMVVMHKGGLATATRDAPTVATASALKYVVLRSGASWRIITKGLAPGARGAAKVPVR